MPALRAFVRERYLEIVIGYLAVQLLFAPLTPWLGDHALVSIGLALLVMLALVTLIHAGELRRRRRNRHLGEEQAFQIPRRGVVFVLAPRYAFDASVCPLVLEHLDPEVVGLLATPQLSDGTRRTYQTAVKEQGRDLEILECDEWSLADIVSKTSTLLRLVAERRSLAPKETVLDITHDTKLLTLGAFIAANDQGVETQCITSEYWPDGQRRKGTERPILIERLERDDPG
jgi:hypothetical protein